MPPSHRAIERRALRPVGNTVRLPAAGPAAVAVLVVDGRPASRAWLRLLARAPPAWLRHFITAQDLEELRVDGRLHVVPRALPAFLVAVDGFFVDAFPAPAPPAAGAATDAAAAACLDAVDERLRHYA